MISFSKNRRWKFTTNMRF